MNVNFGGIIPLSTVDWHGHSSIVIFLNGCPFNCSYCHNYDLLKKSNSFDSEMIKKRILESKPFISSVVFLGGEPLLQIEAVEELASFAKSQNLLVGVHTNGFYPEAVLSLIQKNLADQFFIDIKAPFEVDFYETVIQVPADQAILNIQKSLQIVDQSPIGLEIKTTVFPEIIGSADDIRKISKWIHDHLVQKQKIKFVLQQGQSQNSNNPVFQKMPFLSLQDLEYLADAALEYLVDIPVFIRTQEYGQIERKK
ncbi:MAG: anaerobic ribonucleoside-triphosphate reductase activating protein [Methanimicrococcus sp.]|nr:anaerobic ribonucleoside-triphosphate reductase activating protein [Methanimicrococcus sp.]